MQTNIKKAKDKSMPIFYKATGTLKEMDTENRTATGYFASFDNIDADYDIIRKGAFTKSILERGPQVSANRKIKHLLNHNTRTPAGKILDLKEDDIGLYFESKIENTPEGDVTIERYKEGIYTEHSIGFTYVWANCEYIEISIMQDDKESVIEAFQCRELNLFEGSTLAFLGSNPETPFMGFKGTSDDLTNYLKDEFKFLVKNAPTYEYELQLRQYYHRLLTLAKSEDIQKIKDSKLADMSGIDFNKIANYL